MSGDNWSDFMNGQDLSNWSSDLGFGAGTTGPGSSRYQGDQGATQATDAYNGMTAPTFDPVTGQPVNATSQDPSAMNGVTTNPANYATQTAQMAALSNLAANGGRNAASDANLASIQQNENANSAGQRGAIMQQNSARGMGGSSSNLLAQLSASQGAQSNQNAEDLGVKGQEATTALNAGQGAASIGANMENQQFSEGAAKAQATDAINRFNAGQNTQASEFNSNQNMGAQMANNANTQNQFQDTSNIAAGQQRGGEAGAGYYSAENAAEQRARAGVLGGFMGMAGSYLGQGGGGGSNAAWGGKVPGMANVPGDSLSNDTVKVNTSPGEVIVPRTIAKSGNPAAISSFVQNPPSIKKTPNFGNMDKNKEAMLGALRNLGRK